MTQNTWHELDRKRAGERWISQGVKMKHNQTAEFATLAGVSDAERAAGQLSLLSINQSREKLPTW